MFSKSIAIKSTGWLISAVSFPRKRKFIRKLKKGYSIMQQTMTQYEQSILNDMKDLTPEEQAKLARIFHVIKQEVITSKNERQMTEDFLSVCGTWEDEGTVEQQLQTIYLARKSTDRTSDMF